MSLPFRFRNFLKKLQSRPVAARETRTSRLRPRATPDLLELEDRITPGGTNINITSVSVVDGNDNPLSNVSAGQYVDIQADFQTTNVPLGDSYRVSYTVNGLTQYSNYLTYGAGVSNGTWFEYWGSFVAAPGQNTVVVTVDPDHSVNETTYGDNTEQFTFNGLTPSVGSVSATVAQIRNAYGLNSLPTFNGATADGSGQTIAIVDEFNDPTIYSDLDGFDRAMSETTAVSAPSLYSQYGASSSFLSVYNESGVNISSNVANSGSNGVPTVDPSGGWEGEETMDVEWAHAMAPGAKIDLVETNGGGSNFGDLFIGAGTAASLPGVTDVSMSWIWFEGDWSGSGGAGELSYDTSTFQTPASHPGVTFLASSGDGGTPGGYPAYSPNVVAVGATELTLNNNNYGSETGWSFPTPRTLNFESTSYNQTGSWSTIAGGFTGESATAPGGSASNASWTTNINSSDQGWVGGVEVSATWRPNAANATNATYKIYDGSAATGTLLGTVIVNQTIAPNGTADGNTQFQELGDYYPSSGTVTVVLSASSANGKVDADSVGIAPAWSTGGGLSQYEPEPSYQEAVQQTGQRSIPDVSFDGSSNSGVTCFQNGQLTYGNFGTSLSSPAWAGLMAIVNQGRQAAGGAPFNGPSNPQQALQAIYSLPSTDFNDVTTGYNGYNPSVGYDFVAGLGSPIANLLIPDLTTYAFTPTLTSLSSTSGPLTGGQTITITGTNLLGASAVDFGSIPATSVTVVSPTQLTAVVPAHVAQSVDVTVVTPGGTTAIVPADQYTFIAPPAITKISPSDGPATGGTGITITGTALGNATSVLFGGQPVSIGSDTTTQISVVSPPEPPGPLTISVTTAEGTATVTFTYVPAPSITNVSPSSGPYQGGTPITITGSNLANAAVDFGVAAGVVQSDNGTQIVVDSPVGTVGPVSLTVTTDGGTAGTTFTYYNPLPVVTAVSPLYGLVGGGTAVTITGSQLASATAVDFNGVPASQIISDYAGQIVAVSPGGILAGATDVTVTTSWGTSATSPADQFTYVNPADPTKSYITASSNTVQAGDSITVTLYAEDSTGTKLTQGGQNVTFALSNTTAGNGYFSAVTDNDNGTYTATFTGMLAGTNSIYATLDGTTLSTGTQPIQVTTGPPSLANSTISISPGSVAAGSTATITLQVKDAGGNNLSTTGLLVAFALGGASGGQGGVSQATDNHNGTYTATFTGTIAGANTITATINGLPVTSTPAPIAVTPGPVSLSQSLLSLTTSSVQAGGSTTVTLQARDGYGNNETSGNLNFGFQLDNAFGGQGNFTQLTDNHNGTYSAVFTGKTSGSNSIVATINTMPVTSSTPAISITPGPLSLANSPVTLFSSSITSGSGDTIMLQTEDSYGNSLGTGGLSVSFVLGSTGGGQGTISKVNDLRNGVYTATFTGTTAGVNSIIAKVGTQTVTSGSPQVTITPGPVNPNQSTVQLQSGSVQSGSTDLITVQVVDSNGNGIASGVGVAFQLGGTNGAQGSFGTVNNVGNGVYTAQFTGTIAGTNSITALVNGQPITSSSPTITVTPGPLDAANSEVSLSQESLQAGGGATITLTTVDAAGNVVFVPKLNVAFALASQSGGQGTIGAVTDLGNGVYTASFLGTTAGSNTIDATVGNTPVTATLPVTVTTGPLSTSKSTVTIGGSGTVQAGVGVTVTLQAKDAYGNNLAAGGYSVAFALGSPTGGQGGFTAAKDNHDGTYTATFTGGLEGSNTIVATIGGIPITSTAPTVTVVPGPASLAKSIVTLPANTIPSGPAGTITVSLNTEDAGGNILSNGNLPVSFELGGMSGGQGSFGTVSYQGNGIYTVPFTGTLEGSNTIVALINNQPLTSTAPTITVTPGPLSLLKSVVAPTAPDIQLGGSTTITLQAEDAAGNDIITGGLTVAFALGSTSGAQGTLSHVKDNGNGTYTATFTGASDGSNTITATIGGNPVISPAPTIKVSGAAVSTAKSVTTVASTSVTSGRSVLVTLQADDALGHKETAGGLNVSFKLGSTKGGQGVFGPVTDNQNGTYTAQFTGTLAGANTIVANINGHAVITRAPSLTVTPGAISLQNSSIGFSSATVKAGSAITVTLQARDAAGNKLTSGGQTVLFALGTGNAAGTLSATTDHKNGTYTAVFTGTAEGTNTISATVNKNPVTSTAPTITVAPGAASVAKSILTMSSSTVVSGQSITFTLEAVDGLGNPETSGGLAVSFKLGGAGSGSGVFSKVKDNKDGTYTVTFTGTLAGQNSIVAEIAGKKVTSSTPIITVTPGAPSVTKSELILSSKGVAAGGELTITLIAKDASGNLETSGNLNVTFAMGSTTGGQGTFSDVSYLGNGAYTATFTGSTTDTGTNLLYAAINGEELDVTLVITIG
jgi:adhesin/invasin